MKRVRKDFSILPNEQKNRKQTDLWDVVVGRQRVSTVVGEAKAQELADQLNADPFYLERGQTRFERTGARKSVARTE